MRTIKIIITSDGLATISYKEFLLLKDNLSVFKNSKKPSAINGLFTKGYIYDLIFNVTKYEKDYIDNDIFINIVNEFVLDDVNPYDDDCLVKLSKFFIKDEIELRKDKIKEFITNGE